MLFSDITNFSSLPFDFEHKGRGIFANTRGMFIEKFLSYVKSYSSIAQEAHKQDLFGIFSSLFAEDLILVTLGRYYSEKTRTRSLQNAPSDISLLQKILTCVGSCFFSSRSLGFTLRDLELLAPSLNSLKEKNNPIEALSLTCHLLRTPPSSKSLLRNENLEQNSPPNPEIWFLFCKKIFEFTSITDDHTFTSLSELLLCEEHQTNDPTAEYIATISLLHSLLKIPNEEPFYRYFVECSIDPVGASCQLLQDSKLDPAHKGAYVFCAIQGKPTLSLNELSCILTCLHKSLQDKPPSTIHAQFLFGAIMTLVLKKPWYYPFISGVNPTDLTHTIFSTLQELEELFKKSYWPAFVLNKNNVRQNFIELYLRALKEACYMKFKQPTSTFASTLQKQAIQSSATQIMQEILRLFNQMDPTDPEGIKRKEEVQQEIEEFLC